MQWHMSKLKPHHGHWGLGRLVVISENGMTGCHQCVIPVIWKIKFYCKKWKKKSDHKCLTWSHLCMKTLVNWLLNLVEKTNIMHRISPLLYFICWLLHVLAVVCYLQGASGSVWVMWKIQINMVCCASQLSASGLWVGVSRFSLLCFPAECKWPVCRSVEVQPVVLPSWVQLAGLC
jgi:hypothetical protein